jgi:mycoredoxin
VPEINIWEEPAGAAIVREYAGGNETVPTLVLGDRSLVNPSTRRAVEAIRAYAPELIGPAPERRARRWRRSR